jgi:LacI family transcriptional regulator
MQRRKRSTDAIHEPGYYLSRIAEPARIRQSCMQVGRRLAAMKRRPDAVFACNGVMHWGFLEAFDEEGIRYPGDTVLVTVDDMPGELLRHGRPTTVLQPSYEVGSMDENLLMDRVEGN